MLCFHINLQYLTKSINIHLPIDRMENLVLCEGVIEVSHLSEQVLIHKNETTHVNYQFSPTTSGKIFIYDTCEK